MKDEEPFEAWWTPSEIEEEGFRTADSSRD